MDDQAERARVAKILNLMMSTDSEEEALQCWRSARAIVPSGKLMDHVEAKAKPAFGDFPLGAGMESMFADRMRQAAEEADLKIKVAANRAKSEELKLRERELRIKEREAAVLFAQREREAQMHMPRAAREQADLISGIERLSASNPSWTDRQIARELKVSPSTVGKYRRHTKGCP
jgi:hypothetical protein